MGRLTDLDALIVEFKKRCRGECCCCTEDYCGSGNDGCGCRVIDDAPTVDPVKHGHWVEVQRIHETDHTAICECSLCGDTVWVYDGQRAWNYCPTCGAKMDEVVKDGTDV